MTRLLYFLCLFLDKKARLLYNEAMRPIYDSIVKYIGEKNARFHMPAHFGEECGDKLLYASAPCDITELDFSDNLQNPSSVILQSERLAAEDFGAAECLYFTSGSTSAIFTALGATRNLGDSVILARASHKSVYSALSFFGFTPFYIYTDYDNGLCVPVTDADIEKAILSYPSAAAVVVTSPDYLGRAADIKSIKNICDKHNKILIVDAAHGAHFPYCGLLPDSAAKYADLTAVSFHKTLPVYTGGAALFCNNDALSDKIKALRADLHTTSPSYLTLCSIDYALDKYRKSGEKSYSDLYAEIQDLKSAISNILFLKNDDFTRLVINIGTDGYKLLADNNIVPEMTLDGNAVLILSPENGHNIFMLQRALKNFVPHNEIKKTLSFPAPVTDREYDYAKFYQSEFRNIKDAVGHTAAREAGVYPPGVPVVARGEIITDEIARILQDNNAFGFVNNRICVTIK